MKYKNILLLILSLITLISINISAAKKNMESLDSLNSKLWEGIFFDQIKNSKTRYRNIQKLIREIHFNLSKVKKTYAPLDRKYYQLEFIRSTTTDRPYEYRLVVSEIINVHNQIINNCKELQNLLPLCSKYIKLQNNEIKNLIYLTKKTDSNKMFILGNRVIYRLKTNTVQLRIEKENIKKILKKLIPLENKFKNLTEEIRESLSRDFKNFFFQKGIPVWEINFRYAFLYISQEWVQGLYHNVEIKFPTTLKALIVLLEILTAIVVCAYFIIILIKRKYNSYYESNRLDIRKIIVSFFALMGCITAVFLFDFPVTTAFHRVSIILFGYFSLCFCKFTLETIFHKKIMFHLIYLCYFIFALGIILQLLDFNYELIIIIWPIVLMVTVLLLIIKLDNDNQKLNLCKILFVLFSFGLLATSFCGYVYLSIFISGSIFLAIITFHLGVVLTEFLKKITDKLDILHNLVRSVILGIGTSIIWLFMILFLTLWISNQFGLNFNHTYSYLLSLKIVALHHSLPISKLLLSMYMLLIFKSFYNALSRYALILPENNSQFYKSKNAKLIPSLKNLISYAFITIYLITIMRIFNISITSFLVVLGGISFGIGLGLQELVKNFMSGLVIIFGGLCRFGDIVEINGKLATVHMTDFRKTTLKTFDNCIMTIPNSKITDHEFFNWSKNNEKMRQDIKIGVSYNSNVDTVIDILQTIAKKYNSLNVHTPAVIFDDFGDNSLNFILRIWFNDIEDFIYTPTRIRKEIFDEFKISNIEIPFPQLDIHINNNSDSKGKIS